MADLNFAEAMNVLSSSASSLRRINCNIVTLRRQRALSVDEQCDLIARIFSECHQLRYLALIISFETRLLVRIMDNVAARVPMWESLKLRIAIDGILDDAAVILCAQRHHVDSLRERGCARRFCAEFPF